MKRVAVFLFLVLAMSLSSCGMIFGLFSKDGYANGTISDAYFDVAVGNATIDFFQGIDSTSGVLLHTVTTDSSGYYSVSTKDLGSEGYFTARVTKTGYATATFTLLLSDGTTRANQNSALTPDNVYLSQYRIFLDWGQTPSDLDSHLTGPTEGFDRFHTYYSNKSYTPSGSGSPDVTLDDTSINRTEATTIYNKRSGEYRFYIHDYSNRYSSPSSPSSALSYSGARVRVYQGSSLLATYNMPRDFYGNCWDVFTLNSTTLIPVNAVSYIDGWATGRNLSQENIFADLPEKK
jgi:hypothetical protein